MAKKPKLAHKSQERLALQHELLAFSGCSGLRLFASFLKLDQAYPPLKAPSSPDPKQPTPDGVHNLSRLELG